MISGWRVAESSGLGPSSGCGSIGAAGAFAHVHASTMHRPLMQLIYVVHWPPLAAPWQQTGGRLQPLASLPICGKSTPSWHAGGGEEGQDGREQEQFWKLHVCCGQGATKQLIGGQATPTSHCSFPSRMPLPHAASGLLLALEGHLCVKSSGTFCRPVWGLIML